MVAMELLMVVPEQGSSASVWSSGNKLCEFRGCQAGPNCFGLVESTRGRGGTVWAAKGGAKKSASCTVWSMQKETILQNHILAGPLSALAPSPDGTLLVGAGTGTGYANRLYLWDVATGLVMRTWEGHYRNINVVRWTRDSKTFLSGGDDGYVHVWMVADILNLDQTEAVPHTTFSDHTLPVQDIAVGYGNFRTARVWTCSLDRTVRMRTMDPPRLLATLLFPAELGRLCVEPLERILLVSAMGTASTSEGAVFKFPLYRDSQPVASFEESEVAAFDNERHLLRLPKAAGSVSAMALSLNADKVHVGASAGGVYTFDVTTGVLLSQFEPFTESGPVTAICTFKMPVDWLVQGLNRATSASESVHAMTGTAAQFKSLPLPPMSALRRTFDRNAFQGLQVPVLPPPQSSPWRLDGATTSLAQAIARRIASSSGRQAPAPKLVARQTDDAAELAEVKAQLAKLKRVNERMWQEMVKMSPS